MPLLTEDQARQKWCPFVRFSMSTADGNATNRHNAAGEISQNPRYSQCIASSCMAWRQGSGADGSSHSGECGFCGLAGTPHVIESERGPA